MGGLSFSGTLAAQKAVTCATSHDALLSACKAMTAVSVPSGDGVACQIRDVRDKIAGTCHEFLTGTDADYRAIFPADVERACCAFDAADAKMKQSLGPEPAQQVILPGLHALYGAIQLLSSQISDYGSGLTGLSQTVKATRTKLHSISGQVDASITTDNNTVVDAQNRIAKDQNQQRMDQAGRGAKTLSAVGNFVQGDAERIGSLFGLSSSSGTDAYIDAISKITDAERMSADIAFRKTDIAKAQAQISDEKEDLDRMAAITKEVKKLDAALVGLENSLDGQRSDWIAFASEIQAVSDELSVATSNKTAEQALVFFRAAGTELKIVAKDLRLDFPGGSNANG